MTIDTSFIPGVTQTARHMLLTRYGVSVRRDAWLAAVLAILDRRAELLAAELDTGPQFSLWRVEIGPVTVQAVWSSQDAAIVTILRERAA